MLQVLTLCDTEAVEEAQEQLVQMQLLQLVVQVVLVQHLLFQVHQ